MREAATILSIIRERGERGLPLEDAYRLLYKPTFYLHAYGRISCNAGALTPGITRETVDGMTLEKIQAIIALVRREAYRWTPVRRIHIPKKAGGTRPLGIPTWSDKLLQEVLRLILQAHYEPRFSPCSHGFRPARGCHTALGEVARWTGTKWFIEGDIKGCFDRIDHQVLLAILAQTIRDNRFLRLIRHMLQAGYLEDWTYGKTLSGTPQGGVVSPILANVYLDQLDRFVEQKLLPEYTQGERRREYRPYAALQQRLAYARHRGYGAEAHRLAQSLRRLPSVDPDDPRFRRLRYVRYADDFLLGFIGPKAEAEHIKERLGAFLRATLKLELSQDKTLVTHAASSAARFLGYEITAQHRDDRLTHGRRSVNGIVDLRVPMDVVEQQRSRYVVKGQPRRDVLLMNEGDFTIVERYGLIYRGIVNYYQLATNVSWLHRLEYALENALLHTLANKHHTSVCKIARRFKTTVETPYGPRVCFEAVIQRQDRPPLVARFGGIPLRRQVIARDTGATATPLSDRLPYAGPRLTRNERVQRLLHEECEQCGIRGPLEGHHIRKLADLKRYERTPPKWVELMVARRRKTLYLCHACHVAIEHGRSRSHTVSDARKTATGEPDDGKLSRPVRRGADGKVPAG
jgi:group II intron reverse transcriptase/maturase